MGCTDDPADGENTYWQARGIDPESRRYTCCGVQAFDSRESNKPHLWSCNRIAQIRAGQIPTS